MKKADWNTNSPKSKVISDQALRPAGVTSMVLEVLHFPLMLFGRRAGVERP